MENPDDSYSAWDGMNEGAQTYQLLSFLKCDRYYFYYLPSNVLTSVVTVALISSSLLLYLCSTQRKAVPNLPSLEVNSLVGRLSESPVMWSKVLIAYGHTAQTFVGK